MWDYLYLMGFGDGGNFFCASDAAAQASVHSGVFNAASCHQRKFEIHAEFFESETTPGCLKVMRD